MITLVTNRNCVYKTAYHVIWCSKYRLDILTGDVAGGTGDILDGVCGKHGWPVLSKEIQPDHIHLFVSIPPATSVANAVKVLKGTSARRLFQDFPELKKRLWGGNLWSPSYSVGTAGNVSAETIRQYIQRCEYVTKRR